MRKTNFWVIFSPVWATNAVLSSLKQPTQSVTINKLKVKKRCLEKKYHKTYLHWILARFEVDTMNKKSNERFLELFLLVRPLVFSANENFSLLLDISLSLLSSVFPLLLFTHSLGCWYNVYYYSFMVRQNHWNFWFICSFASPSSWFVPFSSLFATKTCLFALSRSI